MHRLTAGVSIFAATWALSACGLQSPDDGAARTSQDAPRLLVELQSLPYGHPPLPGDSLLPTLPEGHLPVPGYHSAPALPEGHPRVPGARLIRDTAVRRRNGQGNAKPTRVDQHLDRLTRLPV